LIWAAAPGLTVVWAVLLLALGLIPVALVYLTKLLVDSLVELVRAGASWDQAHPALFFLILTGAVMLAAEALQRMLEWVRAAQAEFVQDAIKDLIQHQSARVDLAFYESSEYYDRLEQARADAGSRLLAMIESIGSVVQNGLTLLAMAAVLTAYSPWFPVFLLGGTAPALYVVLRSDRRYHRWWERATVDRRWAQYYDTMLTHSAVAAELRLFGLEAHFRSRYQTLRRQLRTENLHVLKSQGLARFGASAFALLVAGAAMAWMVWRAVQGLGTLGDLALFYQALSRGQGLTRMLLGSLGQVYSNSLFLGNLFAFLDLEPRLAEPTHPTPAPARLTGGIHFRDVSFRYPGSSHQALTGFNLFVPAGQTVAVVGPNGAGKSTLLKLLCRFYDPEAGAVELDGIDIRDMDHEDLWHRITVLFQFPMHYSATAYENIALGDLSTTTGPAEVEAAARGAGANAFIERLPAGYDTALGRWFPDGTDLSGGEWQRMAMARALVRQAPIVLLDEPTSFMDSWDEADWFERFRAFAEGRTAIIITHRFTIAMRAQMIHVMDQGQIVESGTHRELLARGGLYAQSWTAQMQEGVADSSADSPVAEALHIR
jgi:ATP-binding cassette subfamily B protein